MKKFWNFDKNIHQAEKTINIIVDNYKGGIDTV